MEHMTDEQVDARIRQLPVIKEIKDGQEEAIKYFENRFEKGTKRMDHIEEEMKKGFDSIRSSIEKSDGERKHFHKQVMDKLDAEKEKSLMDKLKERDDKNAELMKEIQEKKDQERKAKEQFKNRILNWAERLVWVAVLVYLAKQGINIPSF